MKKYIALIFCVLLSVYVGTACKSSSSTDGNTSAKTVTTTDANGKPSTISKEMKEKIDANTDKKEDNRVATAMMKRAEALAKSRCKCATNANPKKCEERTQRSYDATLKRLPKDKHTEFKANFDTALAACK